MVKLLTLKDLIEYRKNPAYEGSYYLGEEDYDKNNEEHEATVSPEQLRKVAKEWIKYFDSTYPEDKFLSTMFREFFNIDRSELL